MPKSSVYAPSACCPMTSALTLTLCGNDVGEIWLYLPNGTRLLTLKHPQWGVIRDYRFPTPLESRMTYELVLAPPLGYRQPKKIEPLVPYPAGFDTLIHDVPMLPKSASPAIRRVRERMHCTNRLPLLPHYAWDVRQLWPAGRRKPALLQREDERQPLGTDGRRHTPADR